MTDARAGELNRPIFCRCAANMETERARAAPLISRTGDARHSSHTIDCCFLERNSLGKCVRHATVCEDSAAYGTLRLLVLIVMRLLSESGVQTGALWCAADWHLRFCESCSSFDSVVTLHQRPHNFGHPFASKCFNPGNLPQPRRSACAGGFGTKLRVAMNVSLPSGPDPMPVKVT